MSVFDFNQRAWDRLVESGNRWTVPVSSEAIAKARDGDWQLVLTPSLPVPASWFPSLTGCRVLCLASGGGQQGPILSAAGANVTVFDASEKQLLQDRMVADRDGLALETVQGDMADLSCFEDGAFDFIFHPCSNCFAEDIRPVCARPTVCCVLVDLSSVVSCSRFTDCLIPILRSRVGFS